MKSPSARLARCWASLTPGSCVLRLSCGRFANDNETCGGGLDFLPGRAARGQSVPVEVALLKKRRQAWVSLLPLGSWTGSRDPDHVDPGET